MPAYVYRCINADCENTKDVIHSMKEDPEVQCDKCMMPMKKVLSTFNFFFTGKLK